MDSVSPPPLNGRSYDDFIWSKSQMDKDSGFSPIWMPDFLFGFQKYLVEKAVRKGRSAIFADCGMGKTPMQLVWAENVVRKTNGKVLILTPLAVSSQTAREAKKFGISASVSRRGELGENIVITNYERLGYFRPSDFSGVVCDESSCLKAFSGKRRKEVTVFLRKVPFRLLCTATAAPNDYIEMGTSSEALGYLGQMDMLNTFFKSTDDMNHAAWKHGDFWNSHRWVFRPHAEHRFWKWVASWARAIRHPSDYGFEDPGFDLPEKTVNEHVVEKPVLFEGEFLPRVAIGLKEQRDERKHTLVERCEKVAELVSGESVAVAWCQHNNEGDLLEEMIDGARQIKGSMKDDDKESALSDFADGNIRVLVTKPSIAGFGMNWQHCSHMTFFPSHSFEQYYQGVRRCWRFGQKSPVVVDVVTTPGEMGVAANLNRKAEQAAKMFDMLVKYMSDAEHLDRSRSFHEKMESPKWL